MERMIRGAGREPFERDAFYERVVRDGKGRVVRANRHDFAPTQAPGESASLPAHPSTIDPALASI
jgi:hypothetical protein